MLISEDLQAMLGRLAAHVQIVPDSRGTCPALDGDARCDGLLHSAPGQPSTRCRLRYYREERKRLSAQLALCGVGPEVDENETQISLALLRSLDQSRSVSGLRGALAAVRKHLDAWPAGGHFALTGSMGLAKTHILLALFFDALYRGVSAAWVTSGDLRALAQDRESRREQTQDEAMQRLQTLQGRKLLAIDDIADRLTDARARWEPGSTPSAALLLDMLNGTKARLCWSSNLSSDELAQHPDVGPRVVSRLFADYQGSACTVCALGGDDQRQHQMRLGIRSAS